VNRVAASARASDASRVRRAATSTTVLTETATIRKANSARRFSRSATVNIRTGGVKK
jgi:hypothetical protein